MVLRWHGERAEVGLKRGNRWGGNGGSSTNQNGDPWGWNAIHDACVGEEERMLVRCYGKKHAIAENSAE